MYCIRHLQIPQNFCISIGTAVIPPGGGGTPIHYLYGHVPPNGVVILKLLYRTGYPFRRRFLERGIILQTHESSSFVSSHLKLFKDGLLLKIRFNALTSKLLYSCCTLCFSVQGGHILILDQNVYLIASDLYLAPFE